MGEQNDETVGWYRADRPKQVWRARARAVRWLAPIPLLKLAGEVRRTQEFAQLGDKREGQTAYPRQLYRFDLDADGRELWFDYVADIGDGFDPTYAVARCLASDARDVLDPTDCAAGPSPVDPQVTVPDVLPRGRFLIMGGDEVYPDPSEENYRRRTLMPYGHAWPAGPRAERPPYVFALPGNHDWYDELSWFMRFFGQTWRFDPPELQRSDRLVHVDCSGDPPDGRTTDWIGGWRSRQSRSYFALKLPFRWWLLALDTELERELDIGQKAYFTEVRQQMAAGDRVVICAATPSWLESGGRGFSNLRWFQKEILGDDVSVAVFLTGDTHHFAHYESEEVGEAETKLRRIYVTCGGGGAYLSGTHWLRRWRQLRTAEEELTGDVEPSWWQRLRAAAGRTARLPSTVTGNALRVYRMIRGTELKPPVDDKGRPETLELKDCFPSKRESRLAALQLWRILLRHPDLYPALGLVGLPLALLSEYGPLLGDRPAAARWSSAAAALVVVAATVVFALAKRKVTRWVAAPVGFVHGVVQAGLGWWAGAQLLDRLWPVTTARSGGGSNLELLQLPTTFAFPATSVWATAALVVSYVVSAAVWTFLWGFASCAVLSVYLLGASYLWVNTNELYSGLALEDFKSFLRIRVTEDELVIFPLGLRKVPRKWIGSQQVPEGGYRWEPAARQPALAPKLVAEPIVWRVDRRTIDAAPETSARAM